MEIAFTVLASGLGILIGFFVADLGQRAKDRLALTQAGVDFRKAQEELSDLHNQAIKDFKSLNDKVMSHEMAFKTRPLK